MSTNNNRVGVSHAEKTSSQDKDAGISNAFLHKSEDGGHNVSDAFKNDKLMSRRIAFLVNALQRTQNLED